MAINYKDFPAEALNKKKKKNQNRRGKNFPVFHIEKFLQVNRGGSLGTEVASCRRDVSPLSQSSTAFPEGFNDLTYMRWDWSLGVAT